MVYVVLVDKISANLSDRIQPCDSSLFNGLMKLLKMKTANFDLLGKF